jgi:hypothetical protein
VQNAEEGVNVKDFGFAAKAACSNFTLMFPSEELIGLMSDFTLNASKNVSHANERKIVL